MQKVWQHCKIFVENLQICNFCYEKYAKQLKMVQYCHSKRLAKDPYREGQKCAVIEKGLA